MPTLAIFTYDSQTFTEEDFVGHLLKRDINPTTVARRIDAGRIDTTRTSSRQMQFALRLVF